MDAFQIALALGAFLVILVSLKDNRALLWVTVGVASFVVSTAYYRSGGPYPTAITALCDASVCLAIYRYWRERWEFYLFILFQGSVLVSLAYLAGLIGPHWAYVAVLEVINWAALVVIGGTRIVRLIRDAVGDHNRTFAFVRGFDRALHAHVPSAFQ